MVSFILLAIALTVLAAGIIVIPLIRQGDSEATPRAPWAALAASLVIVIGAATLYAALSNWSWREPATATTPQAMVAQLARKLERNPEDLEGWLMLGRSYTVLEQFPLAVRAYQRADRLAGGRNVEALVGLAEALALGNEAELDGRAGRLLEQALALEPRSGKALFYGAAAALRRGDQALARQRFANLLALDPPANVKPILEAQIAAIDRELGTPASPAGSTAAVRVNVMLAPHLRATDAPSAPLFVIVRDPQQPGPPLAVKRLASRFPQAVELTPADSMLAGHTFAAGQQVEVVARIARSGDAKGTRGDPFGRASYRVGRDGVVDVVIDRLMP